MVSPKQKKVVRVGGLHGAQTGENDCRSSMEGRGDKPGSGTLCTRPIDIKGHKEERSEVHLEGKYQKGKGGPQVGNYRGIQWENEGKNGGGRERGWEKRQPTLLWAVSIGN